MPRHHHRTAPTTLEDHLGRMRREFPDIRPFAEEDDLFWWDEGREALEANQLERAEKIFKKLTLAQPEHLDGYYGLALVYHRRQQLRQAVIFADEAVRLGEAMPVDGPDSLDPSTLLELKKFRFQLEPGA